MLECVSDVGSMATVLGPIVGEERSSQLDFEDAGGGDLSMFEEIDWEEPELLVAP